MPCSQNFVVSYQYALYFSPDISSIRCIGVCIFLLCAVVAKEINIKCKSNPAVPQDAISSTEETRAFSFFSECGRCSD